MRVIGFAGNMGSGKSTAAKLIGSEFTNQGLEVRYLAFAESLKKSVCALFNIEPAELEKLKSSNSPCITLNEKSYTMREFLQRYGTEAHRHIFGDDFWIKQLLNQIANFYNNIDLIIIDDIRFENEVNALRSMTCHVEDKTLIFYIKRPSDNDKNQFKTHSSEELNYEELELPIILNNVNLNDLKHQILTQIQSSL
jgi:nucleoside-triphosphatase THEP1